MDKFKKIRAYRFGFILPLVDFLILYPILRDLSISFRHFPSGGGLPVQEQRREQANGRTADRAEQKEQKGAPPSCAGRLLGRTGRACAEVALQNAVGLLQHGVLGRGRVGDGSVAQNEIRRFEQRAVGRAQHDHSLLSAFEHDRYRFLFL